MSLDLTYFLSTLPSLRLGGKAPFSVPDFLQQCKEHLDSALCQKLQGELSLFPASLPNSASDTAKKWVNFENFLRNHLGLLRKNLLARKFDVILNQRESDYFSPYLQRKLEELLSLPSALEREEKLDQIRWSFLDELEGLNPFSISRLEIYYLRLQILEKQASRNATEGAACLEALVQQGQEDADANRVDLNN